MTAASSAPWGLLSATALLLALGGCGHPVGTTSNRAGVSAQTMAACRQRADQVFERQNRGDIYRSDMFAGGQRDAPFGSTSLVGSNPSAGLSSRFARETMVDDCVNAVAGNIGTSPEAPPPEEIGAGGTTAAAGSASLPVPPRPPRR
ncbi:conserved protein of unknown function [Rhodovastum atsumiense]|uniref:Uncharacterized protein n=1 Tax=Rhodovastum atsumiense TaxID=504468 RepID=A0A5M6ISU5_9PROT|nr:hypothetical protein [Rhodovastum atsumiense]KAA5611394.1 hypothetical protein F1189_14760 [Rhodovastum atsumiense]CAH2603595.1 conserved protein of unknown function [Rhodovastum atsumiense]